MPADLRVALTADLHWGINASGDAATRALIAFVQEQALDLLILAGDVGADEHFVPCLELFAALGCHKALIPGNHDIWVREDDARGDSLRVYERHLPEVSAAHGFHYLDQGPLVLREHDVGIVGSINWYDYSWSIDLLRARTDDWQDRLRTKRFSRGRHNDGRFVRWPLDDGRFTARVTAALEAHLEQALRTVSRAIVVTHHAPFYAINYPRSDPPTLDGLLWDAFSGNRTMEAILSCHAAHIPFAFCGHTHREREGTFQGIRGWNIGGDYHYKRLLLLTWPAGTVEAHTFGDPGDK